MTMNNPEVSIIVLTLNAPILKECLDAIFEFTDVNYELIVVCDTPTKERMKLLREASNRHEIKLIVNSTRIGGNKACNQGLRAAISPLISIVSDDVIVSKGWIRPLIQTLHEHPEFGIVTPILSERAGILQEELKSTNNNNHYSGSLGEGSLMTRSLIDKVGYIDECPELYWMGSDGDYYVRVHREGFVMHGVLESQVKHLVCQTLRPDLTDDKLNDPMVFLIKKYGNEILVDQHLLPTYSIKEHKSYPINPMRNGMTIYNNPWYTIPHIDLDGKVKLSYLTLVHSDERRFMFELFNGNYIAKQVKLLQIKKDSILGNHYHEFSEIFCILQGEVTFILQDIDSNKIVKYNMHKCDRLWISSRIAHKAIAAKDTMILEASDGEYISPEVSNIKFEVKE